MFLFGKVLTVGVVVQEGVTPVMDATQLPVVEALHNLGADINRADKRGNTLLMKATRRRIPDIVEYLLQNGVQKDATNDEGQTARDFAVIAGDRQPTLLRMLDGELHLAEQVES